MSRFKIKVTERDRQNPARGAALTCNCDIPTCDNCGCQYVPQLPRTDPTLRTDPEPRAKRPVAPLSE
jgi:hypothetical protein